MYCLSKKYFIKTLSVFCISSASIFSQQTQNLTQPIIAAPITVSYYGWLDQYSINKKHHFVGDEACEPTTSTNGLTYLQNVCPNIFGSKLSGITYNDWERTDNVLIKIMGTTGGKDGGTYNYRLVYGLNEYITQIKNFPEVNFSGQFPPGTWTKQYPKPSYVTVGNPSVEFITTSLASGGAVLLSINYLHSDGGHEVLVNGISWDPAVNNGTLYFIDPLDPSQNYSPEVPVGPVKQTVGEIKLSKNGKNIILEYTQYEGGLPFKTNFAKVKAALDGVLTVGGGAHTPFQNLLTTGNAHAIAEGFSQLDYTTSELIPLLAVLNTLPNSQLQTTFNQFDPSPFNAILFAEQYAAQQVQNVITDHMLLYRQSYCSCSRQYTSNVWATPFTEKIHQHGSSHPLAKGGYDSEINGGVVGGDLFLTNNFLLGGGASYANSDVHWLSASAKGQINSYGGFLHGALVGSPLWLDVGFAYSYNRAKAHRHVYSASPISFIAPIDAEIKHRNHSNVYVGHINVSYDVFETYYAQTEFQLWPYFDVDYINADQSGYLEEGGGTLDLQVSKKHTDLLRPEFGIGCSAFMSTCAQINAFVHAKFGYAKEVRFSGKNTKAYFAGTPASAFSVPGLFPKNDLFCPEIQIGISNPCNTLQLQLSYHGQFGGRFQANEFGGELKINF